MFKVANAKTKEFKLNVKIKESFSSSEEASSSLGKESSLTDHEDHKMTEEVKETDGPLLTRGGDQTDRYSISTEGRGAVFNSNIVNTYIQSSNCAKPNMKSHNKDYYIF